MGKYNDQDNDDYLLKNNLLGIESSEQLEEAEAVSFSLRAMELEQLEFTSDNFTLKGFKELHHHLFQDIYPFAGQIRDVQLMKGSTRFCQVQYLDSYSTDLFCKLNEEPSWNTLEEAAVRLAFFKSELNMLHRFREGNGRTIRICIYRYALSRGIEWDYEIIDRARYMQAMIQSVVYSNIKDTIIMQLMIFIMKIWVILGLRLNLFRFCSVRYITMVLGK